LSAVPLLFQNNVFLFFFFFFWEGTHVLNSESRGAGFYTCGYRNGASLLFVAQSNGFRGTVFTAPNVLIQFVQEIFIQLCACNDPRKFVLHFCRYTVRNTSVRNVLTEFLRVWKVQRTCNVLAGLLLLRLGPIITKRLYAGFSPRRPEFSPRLVLVKLTLDKVALESVSAVGFFFLLPITIHLLLHTNTSQVSEFSESVNKKKVIVS
jgi:hypothetical protein